MTTKMKLEVYLTERFDTGLVKVNGLIDGRETLSVRVYLEPFQSIKETPEGLTLKNISAMSGRTNHNTLVRYTVPTDVAMSWIE